MHAPTPLGPVGHKVVVTELGETPLEAVEHHLKVVAQAPPDPAELGPLDVVIRVSAAAVGWVDLIMASGQYQHVPNPPYTPGLEFSGVVLWTGPDVDPSRLAVGDRALADGFLTGPRSKGAYQRYGGFASYAVAPAGAVMRLPERLTFAQGCNLLGNYETAYHALVARARLQAGETVLIHGATGSTGLAAVHLAKLLGATVIGTGRSAEKLAIVAEQGADHVICTAHDDGSPGVRRFRDEVKALTGGSGARVVYDAVGGDISLESLRCVRFGARFVIVGWASTPFVAKGKGGRGAPNVNVLPTNLIIMKGLDVLGSPAVISVQHDPNLRVERLRQIMEWVHAGALTPYVGEVFPMHQVKDALRAKWASRFVGGCVLQVA